MNTADYNILIVEDDVQIRNFIYHTLNRDGFRAHVSSSGEGALSILLSNPMDILILDLGLPDADGIDVIRRLREWSEIPIIVVSARDEDSEKVKALDLGADDYLTKPFSGNELMARIRVALRHSSKKTTDSENTVYRVGELSINLDSRLVYLNEEEIHITPLEYTLLSLLFKHRGKVLTTKFILKEVYGEYYGTDTQALRALMSSLRRKIEKTPANPRYILTEIGVGYRLLGE